jgi:hypothetical protein
MTCATLNESDRSSISSINFTGLDKLIGIPDGANAFRPRLVNQERLAMMQRKMSNGNETCNDAEENVERQ